MNDNSMSAQVAAVNNPEQGDKPKPCFVALFALICTLLIAGIIGVIVSAVIRKSPTNVGMDAINHLANLANEPATITGTVSLTPEDEESPIANIEISLDLRSRLLPSSLDASVQIVLANGGKIPLTLAVVATNDGKIYFNANDLVAAIDEYLEALGLNANYFDYFDEYSYIASLYDFIAKVENSWWELEPAATYSCLVTALNTFGKDHSQLQQVYADYPFVNFVESGNGYDLSIDQYRYQSAQAAAEKTEVIATYKNCVSTDYYHFDEDEDEEIEDNEESENDEESDYVVNDESDAEAKAFGKWISSINPFASSSNRDTEAATNCIGSHDMNCGGAASVPTALAPPLSKYDIHAELDSEHRFSRLQISGDAGEYTLTANLHFDYKTSVRIETPSKAQPISDLMYSFFDMLDY